MIYSELLANVNRLNNANEDEEEPYKHKYEARKLIQEYLCTLQQSADFSVETRLVQTARLFLILAKNYRECEELSTSKARFSAALRLYWQMPHRLSVAPYIIQTLNGLAGVCLVLGRGMSGFNYLQRAQDLYSKIMTRKQAGNVEGLPPANSYFWTRLEKEHSGSAFFMAQACQGKGLAALAAHYATETLSVQIHNLNSFTQGEFDEEPESNLSLPSPAPAAPEDASEVKLLGRGFGVAEWVGNMVGLSDFFQASSQGWSSFYLLSCCYVIANRAAAEAQDESEKAEFLELAAGVMRDMAQHFHWRLKSSAVLIGQDPTLAVPKLRHSIGLILTAKRKASTLEEEVEAEVEGANIDYSAGVFEVTKQMQVGGGSEVDMLDKVASWIASNGITSDAEATSDVFVASVSPMALPLPPSFISGSDSPSALSWEWNPSALNNPELAGPKDLLVAAFSPPINLKNIDGKYEGFPGWLHDSAISLMLEYTSDLSVFNPSAPPAWPLMTAYLSSPLYNPVKKAQSPCCPDHGTPSSGDATCDPLPAFLSHVASLARSVQDIWSIHRSLTKLAESALKFFELDGHTTDHLRLRVLLSASYKQLLVIESDPARWKVMSHRREKQLKSILAEGVSNTAFVPTIRQVVFDLAHVYQEVHMLATWWKNKSFPGDACTSCFCSPSCQYEAETLSAPLTGRPYWVTPVKQLHEIRRKPDSVVTCQTSSNTLCMHCFKKIAPTKAAPAPLPLEVFPFGASYEAAKKCAEAYLQFCNSFIAQKATESPNPLDRLTFGAGSAVADRDEDVQNDVIIFLTAKMSEARMYMWMSSTVPSLDLIPEAIESAKKAYAAYSFSQAMMKQRAWLVKPGGPFEHEAILTAEMAQLIPMRIQQLMKAQLSNSSKTDQKSEE